MATIARDERAIREISGRATKQAWILAAQSVPEPHGDDRATPEMADESGRVHLVKANIQCLSSLIQQLVELRNEPEEDEYGVLRPTKHAFHQACTLLTDAAIVSALAFGNQIPYGCVSTDSEGGVRIEWVRDSANVHLVVPASDDRDGYVYHEEPSKFDTEAATAEALAHWLRLIKD